MKQRAVTVFRCFKNGDFNVEDKERASKSKLVKGAELEALFDEVSLKDTIKIDVKQKKNLQIH